MRWQLTIAAGYDPTSGTPCVLLILAMAVCAGLVLTPYAVGRRLRESALIDSQQRIAKAQRYRAILAEREQQARVAEERTRSEIARELHDIVAHSLSVMIVQAEGGKALATKKPEKAPEVLDTIAETGREALVEMRRIRHGTGAGRLPGPRSGCLPSRPGGPHQRPQTCWPRRSRLSDLGLFAYRNPCGDCRRRVWRRRPGRWARPRAAGHA